MVINRHVKHITYYALGLTVTKLVSLLTLPIITRLLSLNEYGNLEILVTFINLASIVLGFGLTEALFRFGGRAKTANFMSIICSNAITLSLLIAIALCGPLIIFAKQVAALLPGNISSLQIIYLCMALIAGNVLTVQLDWLRLKEDVTQFVLVSFVRSFLQAVIVLGLLFAGYGVTGIMFANALATILSASYFLLLQFDTPLRFDWLIQKKLFLFGVPLSFNGIAEFILMSLSNWWLAYADGPAALAPFALAMKFAWLTLFLIEPYYMWWNPKRYQHLETDASRKYTAEMSEVGVLTSFVGGYLVTIGGSLLILWVIPSSYHQAIAYLPLACCVLATKFASNMMGTGLYIQRPNFIMYINSIMALLTIVGFYFLVPRWHAWAILLVLQLTLLLRWICYVYLSQRDLYLPYRYIKLIFFVVASALLMLSTLFMNNSVEYIVIGGGGFCLQIVIAYFLKLLPDYKRIIQRSRG
jgi:O-antigen/teichoic acid export membrane protein